MNSETVGIERVRYQERLPLSAAELDGEQYARLSARWRHQIAGHEWGIAVGLAVVVDSNGFTIQTGVAVDGFGRELVLDKPLRYLWTGWDESGQPGMGSANLIDLLFPDSQDDRKIDFWLLWDRQPVLPPAAGRRPSGPDRHTRWLEIPRLRVLQAVDPLDPRAVDQSTYTSGNANSTDGLVCVDTMTAFDPWENPPDDPQHEWPVFLGRVHRERDPNTNQLKYSLDPTISRPYARLIGETVQAVSRLAQIQLSGGPMRARFAVTLRSESGLIDDEHLAIDEPGDLVTHGDTHLFAFAEELNRRMGDLILENRPEVSAGQVNNLLYLTEKLVESTPIAQTMRAELGPELEEKLKQINITGQITWADRQALAGGLSAVLRKGLPAQVVSNLNLPGFPGQPGGRFSLADTPPALPLVVRKRMLLSSAPAGLVPRIDQASATGRLTSQETRDFLNMAYPGFFNQPGSEASTAWGVTFHPLAALPTQAAPWQVYHAVIPPQPAVTSQEVHQLRVELQHPGDKGDPLLYRFVVGYRDEAGTFIECLIVRSDGSVVLAPTSVTIKGKVLEGPIQADPLDPRFGAALLQETLRGVAASTKLSIAIDPPQNAQMVYRVKNNSDKIITCSPIFENILKDMDTVRQGPVDYPIPPLRPGDEWPVPVSTTGLQGSLLVTALVIGVDQDNKPANAKASLKIDIP
jgi:hypothetical protein